MTGKKRIAVLRTSGAILGESGSRSNHALPPLSADSLFLSPAQVVPLASGPPSPLMPSFPAYPGSSSGVGAAITPGALIPRLRALAKDKNVAAVVLRVDSPGGDALASDLMWREIRKLGETGGRA